MATETDFNVPPYFDDYDEEKRFHRILFRPSMAVQARELTQSQTILQNQIERFGNHMFKDGTIVDGVGITYYPAVDYISVEDRFSFANGTQSEVFPTDLDASYLITNSTDSNNAVRATIKIAKDGTKTDPPNTNRFYLDYIVTGTDTANNDVNVFVPGDTLYIYANAQNKFGNLVSNNILYTVNTLATNSTFTSNGQAYCIGVSDGTIFQKGFFTQIEPQVITIQDFSTNAAGYVVGFNTVEEIIDENDDTSLADNALGYSNENAPGAHRLKLIPSLVAKLRTDTANNKNFFAIVEFDGNEPTEQNDDPEYNVIEKQMARKTYEESGDYVINPFQIETRVNSSNALSFFYEISPGLGYVRGNRIEKIGTSKVEVSRAITTEIAQNQIVTANFGNYVVCDEFLGVFDTEQLSEISIYDQPQNSISDYEGVSATPSGNLVGKANVRAVVFETGTKGSPTAQYLLYLFNIRMNSDKSFSADAKSFYATGTLGQAKADIVLENNLAVLKEASKLNTIFDSGLIAVKRLTNNTGIGDTNYTFNQIKSGTLSSGGIVSITIDTAAPGTTTERLNKSVGTLTGSSTDDFNIFLSTAAYSANLSGNVAIVTGNTTITGVGTSFTTAFASNSNIRIYANSTQTYVRRVTSIVNNTVLIVDSVLPVSNADCNFQRYFVAGSPLPLVNIEILSNTSFSANAGITLDSGSQTVYCSYPVNRNQANPIPKVINKNKFVKLDCSNNAANTIGPWILGVPDVHKIRSVHVGTTYANTNPDRSSWFILDSGQRDDVYDLAKLIIKPEYASNINASAKMLVEFDHFTANTNASVGFFSVESYPVDDTNIANTNAIQTIEIPQYNTRDLRNYIDFRPYKSNTAVSTSTIGSATINPILNSNGFSIAATGQYMILPDTNFTADFEYYLPRVDLITLDINGTFSVNKGLPSTTPRAPFIENDQSAIAECYVPAFPSATKREFDIYKNIPSTRINLKTNKRYTMKDIGALDARLKIVEYYTVLNVLEQQARDITIPDVNGLDRFKNGIFADPFNSHNIGNVSDFEYKISIDPRETVARPYFQRHDVDFTFIPNSSSSAVKSDNVVQKGPYVMLSYTHELFIDQRFATKIRNAAESVWQWNGSLDLYPSYDFFRDEQFVPNMNINLDLTTPWEQFAQSPWGTIYGDWRLANTTATYVDTGGFFGKRGYGGWVTTTTTTTKTYERIIEELKINSLNENIELGPYVKDISVQPFMRSKLVAFVAFNMKPNTTLYPFFDDVNVSAHCAPGVLSGIIEPEQGKEDRIVNQNGNFGDPLISNANGFVCGLFRIPAETFRTGDRIFQLTNVDNLVTGADAKITTGSSTFTADNLSVTKSSTTLNIRQPQVKYVERKEQYATIEISTGTRYKHVTDPIAQSIIVPDIIDQDERLIPGMFVSKIGVFFQSKDPVLGCTVFVCEMDANFPDMNRILGKAHLNSADINVSSDASSETIFELDFPVYLLTNSDYAFVVQPDGNSPEYNIWVAETGDFDVLTDEQVFTNPYVGIMFVSANRKTWTPIQKEDIKFKFYRARFVNTDIANYATGSAIFKNENDEYLTVNGFTKANSSLAISVGDIVYTVNASANIGSVDSIISNTLSASVSGRVQYINEADGELWLDSSTANSTTYFSNTTNPIIAIYRPANTSNTALLNSNTFIAYANVMSVDNLKYHAVVPAFGMLQPARTTTSFEFKGTSNASVTDVSYTLVDNNDDHEFFDNERQAMSRSNEITGLTGEKSSIFKINMTTDACFVSPVINLSKKSSLFVQNLINNDANNEHTRYGNAISKYVSKKIILADGQEAEDLRVYLTAYRPVDTDIKVYAKFWNSADPDVFEDKVWTELQYDLGGNLVYSSTTDNRNFIEYQFSVPSINSVAYGAFSNNGVDTYNPLNGGVVIESSNNIIVAKQHSFNANTDVSNAADTIAITNANTFFNVEDAVIYNVSNGNTAISGLTSGGKYYVRFSNSTVLTLSETRTGANISLTASSTSETGHFLTGTFFTEDFDVGDRIRVTSNNYVAVRTITNISNNTYMTVDNGLEATDNAAIYYVFASGGADGIVEYENPSSSRFIGYKEVALKVVLLSNKTISVPRLNDIRAICLQV